MTQQPPSFRSRCLATDTEPRYPSPAGNPGTCARGCHRYWSDGSPTSHDWYLTSPAAADTTPGCHPGQRHQWGSRPLGAAHRQPVTSPVLTPWWGRIGPDGLRPTSPPTPQRKEPHHADLRALPRPPHRTGLRRRHHRALRHGKALLLPSTNHPSRSRPNRAPARTAKPPSGPTLRTMPRGPGTLRPPHTSKGSGSEKPVSSRSVFGRADAFGGRGVGKGICGSVFQITKSQARERTRTAWGWSWPRSRARW